MHCPRLQHFVRFNPKGTVSRCGHMIGAPEFKDLIELEHSSWLYDIKQKTWPAECVRCRQSESLGLPSIRTHAIAFHQQQTRPDYLVVGGVLDNICNSACQFCSADLSTKLGSLTTKNFVQHDNSLAFWKLPLHRVVQLDINGGEPSASPNYRRVLQNLPTNVHTVRVNTNCSTVIPELANIAARGVRVIVTVSFDGVNKIHDYVRWPIAWKKFEQNLNIYRSMSNIELNHWITINTLNIVDLDNIFNYLDQHNSNYDWAILHSPSVLNPRYRNKFTEHAVTKLKHPNSVQVLSEIACDTNNDTELMTWIKQQDQLRNINVGDYYMLS